MHLKPKITCLYGAESPEIVEGRQRNSDQVQRLVEIILIGKLNVAI
jgi:hypothetical protein